MASSTEIPTEDSEVESSPSTLQNGDQTTALSLSTAVNTTNSTSSLNTTRLELEKWQLQHNTQLLKLEVAQKNIIIDTLKTEHLQQIQELEEIISELKSDSNLLQQRLKTITKINEEEKLDLQRQLREAIKPHPTSPPSPSLMMSDDVIKCHIEGALSQGVNIPSEGSYKELIEKNTLTLSDIIQVRLYEIVHPYINEGVWLRETNKELESNLQKEDKEKTNLIKKLKELESEIERLQLEYTRLMEEKKQMISLRNGQDFKSGHYDVIKNERDHYEKEVDKLKHTLIEKEFNERAMNEERERLNTELSSFQHSNSLHKQDKEYLQKQVTELSQRTREVQDKAEEMERRHSECKQSKEQLYEQMIKQKKEAKEDYDTRLQKELEALRLKTNAQIDALKVQTREMYERENRVLQQARDGAMEDRERAVEKQKELEMKYEHVFNELRQLQVSSDGQVTGINSQLQMKSFELDRVRVLYDETITNLKKSERERQSLRHKLDSLASQSERTIRDLQSLVRELETKLKERNDRLETYEKLEHELDDVVMQAASLEDDGDVDRVLLSYGFGTSVPSSSRRRMQQSVQLARRVLKLERINASLRQQVASEEKDRHKLKEQLSKLKSQFDLASQPHKYLLETLQTRDCHLERLQTTNTNLETKISDLEKKVSQLVKEKNNLAMDLERLLLHQEEISLIKGLITKSSERGRYHVPQVKKDAISQGQPTPTIFTRPQPLSRSNAPNQK